jgi:hypothetical protein
MDFAIHHSMRERGHFAKAIGLSIPQFSVLMQLHYRGVCGRINLTGKGEKTLSAKTDLEFIRLGALLKV